MSPPKRLEYADYMLPFELLFRDIKTNDLATSNSSSIKSKLLGIAFTSYIEKKTCQKFTKSKTLLIQKGDKGNTVVIVYKNDYKTKIKNILFDSPKFKELETDENKQLDFYSTVRRNSMISSNFYIKMSVSLRKNMTAFIQWD